MYGLPVSTEIKKQLPKKAIHAKFDLKASQRESFDADIARIDIVAVISQTTLPALNAGDLVKEFYVLEVQLKHKEYDEKNISLLTKLIPQKLVFALRYEQQVQFAVYHTKFFFSAWQDTDEAILQISGLGLDTVWENLVKDIGQIDVSEGNTLSEQIITNDRQEKIKALIAALERKMVKEKQPRRKREYFEQIKKLKEQL